MHDSVGNNGNNVHNSTTQYFTYIWHHIFFDNGACCGLCVQVPYFAALFGLPPLWQIGAQLFKPSSEPKFPACLRYIKDMPLRRGLKCVSQRYFFQDTPCAKLQLQWRQNPLSFFTWISAEVWCFWSTLSLLSLCFIFGDSFYGHDQIQANILLTLLSCPHCLISLCLSDAGHNFNRQGPTV